MEGWGSGRGWCWQCPPSDQSPASPPPPPRSYTVYAKHRFWKKIIGEQEAEAITQMEQANSASFRLGAAEGGKPVTATALPKQQY